MSFDKNNQLTIIDPLEDKISNGNNGYSKETISERIINFLSEWVTRIILCFVIWSLLWVTYGLITLPPSSPVFSLMIVWLTATILGQCCLPFGLPPLLGMMISGIALANFPYTVVTLDSKLSSLLRMIALTIILLRAGLGLDPKVIKILSGVCFRLAFLPCIAEAITITLTSYLIIGFPLQWGLLLGFVIGAVSPAVVVPTMIDLQQQGYGIDKGIPSLVIASSSVDDIFAITGFDVALTFAFVSHESSLLWNIVKGPGEAIIGLLIGLLSGLILWYIPKPVHTVDKKSQDNLSFAQFQSTCQRFGLTITIGSALVLVTANLEVGGIGPLAALVVTFVAAIRWRPNQLDIEIENGLKVAWLLFEPFLFSLVGAEIKFNQIQVDRFFPVIFCLIISLAVRCLASFISLYGSSLNGKEKCFIAIAWLPKATVQAAIGPIALDLARKDGDKQAISNGVFVLMSAILSILLTAPIGAALIKLSAPKLLTKSSQETNIT